MYSTALLEGRSGQCIRKRKAQSNSGRVRLRMWTFAFSDQNLETRLARPALIHIVHDAPCTVHRWARGKVRRARVHNRREHEVS